MQQAFLRNLLEQGLFLGGLLDAKELGKVHKGHAPQDVVAAADGRGQDAKHARGDDGLDDLRFGRGSRGREVCE